MKSCILSEDLRDGTVGPANGPDMPTSSTNIGFFPSFLELLATEFGIDAGTGGGEGSSSLIGVSNANMRLGLAALVESGPNADICIGLPGTTDSRRRSASISFTLSCSLLLMLINERCPLFALVRLSREVRSPACSDLL